MVEGCAEHNVLHIDKILQNTLKARYIINEFFLPFYIKIIAAPVAACQSQKFQILTINNLQ